MWLLARRGSFFEQASYNDVGSATGMNRTYRSERRGILNYFRKIIYLCEYNGGECRGNIGFVKLSKKQTRFKIEISLSGDWSLKGEKVYLLDKDKNAVNKVFFGTITEEGREISITKQTSEAGMLKGQLAGVLIGGEGYVVCAGTEDDSVRVGDYVKAEREDGHGVDVAEMREGNAAKVKEADEKETREVKVAKAKEADEKETREGSATEKGNRGGVLPADPVGRTSGPENKGQTVQDGKKKLESVAEKVETGGEEQETDRDTLTGGENREKEKKSTMKKEIQGEELPEEEEMIEVEVEEEHDQAYMFRKLFTAKPNMYPFEDDEMEKCVQISPGDFSDFPKEYWHLGSNTFLLQGYYNYRHLILARDRDKVYVGIPGQYHRRDKYMADMFGFGRFKSILRKKERLGDFGYWMKEIEVMPSSESAVCVTERKV